MAVLPIRISGEAVLHTPALPVVDFDESLHGLVADMFDTMDAAPGVGLAGPQVGVNQRLFTYGWTDEDGKSWRGVAINPELWITPAEPGPADEDEDTEGCLSFPGERFPLRRSQQAILRAVDADGVPFEIRASGWLARILQHEFDHLNGILYIDRLEAEYEREVRKITRKRGWGEPGNYWVPGIDNLEGEDQ